MPSPNKYIHIIPFGGAWAIKKEGQDKALKIALTKSEAIKEAKKIANSGKIIVHNKIGSRRLNGS